MSLVNYKAKKSTMKVSLVSYMNMLNIRRMKAAVAVFRIPVVRQSYYYSNNDKER